MCDFLIFLGLIFNLVLLQLLLLAVVADGSPPDADAAVQAAHRAFALWKRCSSRERAKTLLRISDLIRKNAEELAVLESKNVGKPIRESRDEVQLAADCFQYYAGVVDKVGGSTVPVAAQGIGLTFREPLGVCALIVPWNFPIAFRAGSLLPLSPWETRWS